MRVDVEEIGFAQIVTLHLRILQLYKFKGKIKLL